MVLKIMFNVKDAQSLMNRIERLLTISVKKQFYKIPSLESLLITPFISENGACCLLMPEAHGSTLMDEFLETVRQLSIKDRIFLAQQISEGVRVIHDARIIHADIAGPNIIIDISQKRAYIIDIDGGGLLNKFKPRVWGHPGWHAPEVIDDDGNYDENRLPDQNSDCWSLAVVLHEIITGLSPFYFCENIKEISKYQNNWLPSPDEVKNEYRQYLKWHLQEINKVPELYELFKETFGPGQNDFKKRPSARRWKQVLSQCYGMIPLIFKNCSKCGKQNNWDLIYCDSDSCAQIIHGSAYRCNSCNYQFIPINAAFCPMCGMKQAL
jgi:serine/threonine protein kinase